MIALALAFVTIAAACGGNDSDDDSGGGGSSDVADDLTGSVTVSGSSTVEPITALVGELFNEQAPAVSVRVDGPGTGDGFQLFCQGETDISDASRAIKDEEAQACADAGIEYVELKVGIDGLSVITSSNNDEVECLTFGDLYALLGPESEGFENWADANDLATEAGGTGGFPDAPLDITAPGEESGTYDSFIEIVLEGTAEERVASGAITEEQIETPRKDYSSQANDNAIIDGIAGSDTSLGWVGYAFADENRDRVRLLEVDGGEGCVAPDPDTIADGSYPVARDLFIYVNLQRAADSPAVQQFVDFYLSDDGFQAVVDAGYIQLPEEDWATTGDNWATAAPA